MFLELEQTAQHARWLDDWLEHSEFLHVILDKEYWINNSKNSHFLCSSHLVIFLNINHLVTSLPFQLSTSIEEVLFILINYPLSLVNLKILSSIPIELITPQFCCKKIKKSAHTCTNRNKLQIWCFWHKHWCSSRSLSRRSTGNNVIEPLPSPNFSIYLLLPS